MAFLKKFLKKDDGSIAVETALIMSVIGVMAVGILDFGLVYSRNVQLANAARAGMQYALVRKPVDDDFSAIVNAVIAAAPAENDNKDRAIGTVMFCECPDGTSIDCTGEGGQDLTCEDGSLRAAYLEITISESYNMFFGVPGVANDLKLSESVTVRLN